MCSRVFLYLFENVLVICHKPKDNFSLHSIFRVRTCIYHTHSHSVVVVLLGY